MKCISKQKTIYIICFALLIICMSGCGNLSYDMAYHADSDISTFNVVSKQETRRASAFAEDLCVVTVDVEHELVTVDEELSGASGLFEVNSNGVIYAKNIHDKVYPASLTKVMTALVALENGRLEQILTATKAINITESGAQLCGLKVGDTMTLDQALRILLLYSANDVAMMIAENIGGSVDGFVEMMNEKAHQLGATNTNFTNPHGLTDIDHYTTSYDLYLIFNEAIQNETFNEIIHMTSYQTVYHDKDGKDKEFSKTTTNLFLRGDQSAPANVTVIGGKTGTTNAAGHCLVLLSRDKGGAPYISIVMRSETLDDLYAEMKDLLAVIGN